MKPWLSYSLDIPCPEHDCDAFLNECRCRIVAVNDYRNQVLVCEDIEVKPAVEISFDDILTVEIWGDFPDDFEDALDKVLPEWDKLVKRLIHRYRQHQHNQKASEVVG